jgi:HSP20 family protein
MNPLAEWNQSRWNQLNELEELRHALGSAFRGSGVRRPEEDTEAPERIPVVDVSEDARGYVIKAELPQVKREDMEITMADGTLTITGARKFNQNSKKDHPQPLACGRFVHCFAVPSDARPARVTTVFANEILTVHLARNEKAKVRRAEAEACLASTVQRTKSIAQAVRQARISESRNINKKKTRIENAIHPTQKPHQP